jgi:hypothetical protein
VPAVKIKLSTLVLSGPVGSFSLGTDKNFCTVSIFFSQISLLNSETDRSEPIQPSLIFRIWVDPNWWSFEKNVSTELNFRAKKYLLKAERVSDFE